MTRSLRRRKRLRASESIIGHKIGNYEILSLIGAGGMGEVYLARDARLDRQIALKFLPAQFTADPAQVRRFEREARAASALNHPNIITIHDIGREGDMHFIATEFMQGRTLREIMRRGRMELPESFGRLPLRSPARWRRRMLQASSIATSSRRT